MAITIFPQEPGLGTLLGTGLGSGLARSLQNLAQQKMGQLAQRQQQTRMQQALSGLGVPQKTAAAISALPEQLQAEYIKNLRRQQHEQVLSQALGGAFGIPTEGVARIPETQLSALFGGGALSPQQMVQLAQMQQRERLSQEKMKQREQLAREKLSAREREQIDRETLKPYEKYSVAAEDARNKIPLAEEFIRISLQGKPGSPAGNTMREMIGNMVFGKNVPKDWIYTDDATVQKKLSAQLVKLTLEKMQGRKSVEVLRAIQRTFPNVHQNRDAQIAIAKTLLYEYSMNDLKDRLQDKIIAENAGRRPRNLKSLVEKASKRLEPLIAKKYLPKLAGYKEAGGTFV